MSLLAKLFGGGKGAAAPEPEDYKGFLIFAEPTPQDGKFRIGARIEKEIGGELKIHTLIRADMLDDMETGQEASIRKAKQVIDEQGDALFRAG
ncbi:HlyU family transcriptional regulator [Yoonia sp. BS5-3]|uniref:HlyU family transcriptional regulator n=1 Tax=Yoonia phaeophyticola TaxID=3137369 RepID=A0ABZ2V1S2_9RHOB